MQDPLTSRQISTGIGCVISQWTAGLVSWNLSGENAEEMKVAYILRITAVTIKQQYLYEQLLFMNDANRFSNRL